MTIEALIKSIEQQIANAKTELELGTIMHAVPDLLRGHAEHAIIGPLFAKIEQQRLLLNEFKYITRMTVEDRARYLSSKHEHNSFAQSVQQHVVAELANPTLPHVAEILQKLEYLPNLADLHNASIQVTEYLNAHHWELNWQYAVFSELDVRVKATLVRAYQAYARTATVPELRAKIAELHAERFSVGARLGYSSAHIWNLDACLRICSAALKIAKLAGVSFRFPNASQQAHLDPKYRLNPL